MMNEIELLEKLNALHCLSEKEYEFLISKQNDFISLLASKYADVARRKYYGNKVFIRGLIEIGNICRNDCYYCGIRKSNKNCNRYVLSREEILSSCKEGYDIGFRTFVLQGGEGVIPVDEVCGIVERIKNEFHDCAVTLSLGEYSFNEYEKMFLCGADRYLLRHETADREHYKKLHPENMSFENRMECLFNLKKIGFQVGCGFMVGSPWQSEKTLAKDLKFIEEFQPDMCGIGPFIPQKDTPLGKYNAGSVERTLFLLSLIRLIKPNILLPATTALGSLKNNGRQRGIISGANVIMPNLTPAEKRKDYILYDNKLSEGEESAQNTDLIKNRIEKIGYRIVVARGDINKTI